MSRNAVSNTSENCPWLGKCAHERPTPLECSHQPKLASQRKWQENESKKQRPRKKSAFLIISWLKAGRWINFPTSTSACAWFEWIIRNYAFNEGSSEHDSSGCQCVCAIGRLMKHAQQTIGNQKWMESVRNLNVQHRIWFQHLERWGKCHKAYLRREQVISFDRWLLKRFYALHCSAKDAQRNERDHKKCQPEQLILKHSTRSGEAQ